MGSVPHFGALYDSIVYVACNRKLSEILSISRGFVGGVVGKTHIACYDLGVDHAVEYAPLGAPAAGEGDEDAADVAVVAYWDAGSGSGVEQGAVERDIWISGIEH